jgi:hypothetical protein
MWNLIAKLAARPAVVRWLKRRALKTPYLHIMKDDDVYMERYWLFNPYQLSSEKKTWRRQWLPSARLHWIRMPDTDRAPHDHPWDARTIILEGAYTERRLLGFSQIHDEYTEYYGRVTRGAGETATLKFGEYHSIETISPGGVWTLFITWKYQGTWGFLVDGKKVQYKKYLGL